MRPSSMHYVDALKPKFLVTAYASMSTSLWLMANSASSRRVETPVLSKTFDRWRFTVSSLMVNCLAMSLLLQPSTMQVTTSSSRGVRP